MIEKIEIRPGSTFDRFNIELKGGVRAEIVKGLGGYTMVESNNVAAEEALAELAEALSKTVLDWQAGEAKKTGRQRP